MRGPAGAPRRPFDRGSNMTTSAFTYRLPARAAGLLGVLVIVGGLTLAGGMLLAPQRTWLNVLLLSNYLVGLGLGGLLLLSFHYVTGARWSTPQRRVPE